MPSNNETERRGRPERPHWQLTWPARVRSSDFVRCSFLCYFKPQRALPPARITSNDTVGSDASNKWLRFACVPELADKFALRITKLNRRTAKRQRNQLA